MNMGMTMAEKVLARASGRKVVTPGEYLTAPIDLLLINDRGFLETYEAMLQSGLTKVWDPDRIVVVIDHSVPAPSVNGAEEHQKIRSYVQSLMIKNFYDVAEGIEHQLLIEKGHIVPGLLMVGGDSHTTTHGALGAAASGIGATEVAYAMVKGSLWFRVPPTIKFVLKGTLPKAVSAKDIVLKIAGQYSIEVGQYKSVEFTGPAAEALSVEERINISNMGVEIGTKFAFFKADGKTLDYLKGRTRQPAESFGPDPDARYETVYEMDVSSLEPQVACPHSVGNVKPISDIGDVPVQQAFIGSCTNAQAEDLNRAAAILKGRRIHPKTRMLVIPASREIYLRCVTSGAIQALVEAGAMIGTPGCGACGGQNPGVLGAGETAISGANRNFEGRMGSPKSFIYLGSPETVAASAIEGKIADPRKYVR
jgi:3-isopropylmalate/(R)-2-methylmalate dehydratase large subunit